MQKERPITKMGISYGSGSHNVSGQIIVICISLLFLQLSLIQISAREIDYEQLPGRGISLSGEVDIYDAADTLITGKTLDGVGHRMGSYVHVGDYNNDGYNDLAISSMEDYSSNGIRGDGRIYIFFGNESGLPDQMDLDTAQADHIIMGTAFPMSDNHVDVGGLTNIGSQLECGDFNNDSYTDLVISLPGQFCLRLAFIIWGQQGGWPREILVNQSNTNGYGYNGTILNSGLYSKDLVKIWEGVPGQPSGGFGLDRDITNDYMIAEDIDNDGYDDLISGGYITEFRGWLPRIWTFSIYWGATGNKTVLYEEQGQSFLGKSIDIGDIDGDGQLDAVVGAPYMAKEFGSMDKYGATYLLFNISKLKFGEYRNDERLTPFNESYDTVIWGSGKYDWFGNKVRLYDTNGDGMDEIFVGSPYADGPADFNQDSGQIYMFKGRPRNGFIKEMDADNDADNIVFGDQGFVSGNPDIMGDHLGNRFEIADIDANGDLEFIAALPLKDLPPVEYRQRYKAGLVLVYKFKDLFNDDNSIVQISNSKGIFILQGYDMEDNFGYQLLLEDVDTDGIKDILLTSPMADGSNNTRPRCGEAYVLRGKGLVIKDIDLSGPSVNGREIFLGSGKTSLKLPFTNTKGSDKISQGKITIDPGRMDLEIEFSRNGYNLSESLRGSLLDENMSLEWTDNREKGEVEIRSSLNWDLVTNKWLRINIEFISDTNETITRSFPRALILRNDVVIKGKPDSYHDGVVVEKPGRWFTPGELFGIDKPVIRYKHDAERLVNESPMHFQLIKDDDLILDSKPQSSSGRLETAIEAISWYELYLKVTAPDNYGKKWRFSKPNTGDPYHFKLPVDIEKPLRPQEIELGSDGISNLSSTGNFEISWRSSIGIQGDHNESGIKYYKVSYDNRTEIPMKEGGLFASYYQDHHNLHCGLERLDNTLDFLDWGLWSPDPSLIPPDYFSARWHGSINMEGDYDKYIRFLGVGDIKVFIDDELMLDWFDLMGSPTIGPFSDPGLSTLPIEIYYKHDTGRSGIKMEYLYPNGEFDVMDESMLLHPYNISDIEQSKEGSVDISVSSVDWTGKISTPSYRKGFIDDKGPNIEFLDLDVWYPDNDISIKIQIDDGDPSISSGLDTGSIRYRLREDSGEWTDWTDDDLWFLERSENEKQQMIITPVLDTDWRGAVQIRAEDNLDNPSLSSMIWFGIDHSPPEMNLLEPDDGRSITSSEVDILMEYVDIGGSGVNLSSINIRYSLDGGKFTGWLPIEGYSENGRYLSKFTFKDMEGAIVYQFSISDNVGNSMVSEKYTVNISMIKIDLPPVPVIKSPEEGAVFDYGALITFTAEGTTDDRTYDLTFTWTSSIDGYLGSGLVMDAILTSGDHTIRLYVYDGTPGNNKTVSINLTVNEKVDIIDDRDDDKKDEKDDGIDPVLFLFPLLILGIIAIISAVMLKKRFENSPSEQVVVEAGDPNIYRTSDLEE